jgi:hypothetical protein
MNRRNFFKITFGLTALATGVKAFASVPEKTLTSLDKVGVRRLFVEIKKFMERTAKHYVFEPNDQKTRDSFKEIVDSYLEQIKQRHGIQKYQLICDETNNLDVVDKNVIYGQLWIQQKKDSEYIILDFSICPTKWENDYKLKGWDCVKDPLLGYEIKS